MTAGRRAASVVLAGAALVALAGVPTAAGRTFEVTRRDDPAPGQCRANNCSLREAVRAANARPGADVVKLDTDKLYKLQRAPASPDDPESGDLDVSDPLTVLGTGDAPRARVDGNNHDRIFHAEDAGRFTVKRLTFFGGGTDGDGGAILLDGFGEGTRLTVRRSFFDGNFAQNGGAIYANGDRPARIARSFFWRNEADFEGGDGGAVFLDDGGALERVRLLENRAARGGGLLTFDATTFEHVLVRDNRAEESEGGGLYLYDYDIPIRDSVIAGNRSADPGGGIFSAFGEIRLLGTTVKRNVSGTDLAGGGGGMAASGGSIAIKNSSILANRSHGFGGGLHLADAVDATITRSTVARNKAIDNNGGGGITVRDAGTQLTLESSTVAENEAEGFGGGIEALFDAVVSIESSTVAYNAANSDGPGAETGGGIGNGDADVTLKDSLFGNNSAAGAGSGRDCDGAVSTIGVNLIEAPLGCAGAGDPDITGVDPRTRRLHDNGGRTLTVALRASSPALNSAGPDVPETDQRGVRRQNPDIGAFERR